MTSVLPSNTDIVIRPLQYRDLAAIERLFREESDTAYCTRSVAISRQLHRLRQWYSPLKLLRWFPYQSQHWHRTHVAEQANQIRGVIQVSPFNRARSTWRVDHVAVDPTASVLGIGSQLLRHCFETILEARTWLLEVNVNHSDALSLYRQNGFQPLAKMTYWEIAVAQLQNLAAREPDLPNFLPIGNADAALLYQLDTAAMPPLVRQVFDRYPHDFKTGLFNGWLSSVGQRISQTQTISGYVFEPQRKAAIGYLQVQLCRDGSQPHVAQLTVHPAYTWLYPELLTQMARLTQNLPQQQLQIASSDFQPEREAYLERVGAQRVEHTLMMSRSVWHKVRES
ncbi:MAG TPA: GNAT family N-acetyltransferase, partial [Candidatus Caenarcaniphilales bacterium]